MILYFDMDGVLADWSGGFEKKFPELTYEEFKAMPEKKREVFCKLIDASPDFYFTLEPIEPIVQAFKICAEQDFEIEMLTSVGIYNPDHLIAQKRDWVQKYLGEYKVNTVNSSAEKAQYAHSNTILIDDRLESIDPFVAAGGIGILFNGLNATQPHDLLKQLKLVLPALQLV